MSRPNPDLIAALRATAARLEGGADYRWTHMGSCNCGHMAQTLTRLPAAEIHRLALERAGDWGEQAREYCPSSGFPMDHVLAVMLDAGLDRDDVWHLEWLSDPAVLRRLPVGERDLDHRRREDVLLYLRLWADRLEERWLFEVQAVFEGGLGSADGKRPSRRIGDGLSGAATTRFAKGTPTSRGETTPCRGGELSSEPVAHRRATR